MIKLNRIGNKLGLAGAVGVSLSIGMVANPLVEVGYIRLRHFPYAQLG